MATKSGLKTKRFDGGKGSRGAQMAKRKFREQQYKSLKKEMQDKHQEKLMHEYKKVLRKEDSSMKQWQSKVSKLYSEIDDAPTTKSSSKHQHSHPQKHATAQKGDIKLSKFHKAEKHRRVKNDFKKKKLQENIQKDKERSDALSQYHVKKRKTHSKIAKRNYKGQPNMASQMELILKKIEGDKS